MVALKYKRRLLIAELGQQTTLLTPQTQNISTRTPKITLQQNLNLMFKFTDQPSSGCHYYDKLV